MYNIVPLTLLLTVCNLGESDYVDGVTTEIWSASSDQGSMRLMKRELLPIRVAIVVRDNEESNLFSVLFHFKVCFVFILSLG